MHPTRREFLRISSGLAAATLATTIPMNRALAFGSAAREPSFLAGHFAPVNIETEAFGLTVRGAIPPELSGRYLRNGHNPVDGENRGA
jgi:carotenoid cleavage dioxygenase-like enzyme